MDKKITLLIVVVAAIAAVILIYLLLIRRAVAFAAVSQQISLSNQNPTGSINIGVSTSPGSSVPVTITVSLSNGQPNSNYTVFDAITNSSHILTTDSSGSASVTINYSISSSFTQLIDVIIIKGPGIQNQFTANINYSISTSSPSVITSSVGILILASGT